MRRSLNATTALIASLSMALPTVLPAQEAGGYVCPDDAAAACAAVLAQGLELTAANVAAAQDAAGEGAVAPTATPEPAAAAPEVAAPEAAATEAAPVAAAPEVAAPEAAATEAAPVAATPEAATPEAAASEAAPEAAPEAVAPEAVAPEEANEDAPDAVAPEVATPEPIAPAEPAATQDAVPAPAAAPAETAAPEAAPTPADAAPADVATAPDPSDGASQEGAASADAAVVPETADPAAPAPAPDDPATDPLKAAIEDAAGVSPAGETPAAAAPAPSNDAAAPAPADAAAATAPPATTPATPTQPADAAAVPAETQPATAAPVAPPPAADAPAATQAIPTDLGAAVRAAQTPTADQASADAAPVESLAAQATETTDAPDVATEVVTEETSRSSGEDFATAAEAKKSDGGLSDLEKALLIGAGALAVGGIISRNRAVVSTSPDRVVVERQDGTYEILKDDGTLLRRPGSQVQTQTYDDGSTRQVVTRTDGSSIVTIRDPELRVLRRTKVLPDGSEVALIDDTVAATPVDVSTLPQPAFRQVTAAFDDEAALRAALAASPAYDRTFSLAQVRDISEVRNLAPAVDIDAITFPSGSAAIPPDQAQKLVALGGAITGLVAQDPRQVFLIEGYTDTVGDAASNLALSDRRAESVALAMAEYFDVPPENMIVQGYGERFLRVPVEGPEERNRRVNVRNITTLLETAAASN